MDILMRVLADKLEKGEIKLEIHREVLGEIEKIKGEPADNHLSYIMYKDAREAVSAYEENLQKYKTNYKESRYIDCFLTEHDLKIIRQIKLLAFLSIYT